MPATLGSVTTHAFEHDPEAHKLHLEFEVASAQTVHPADPVTLDTDGKIRAAATGAAKQNVIGVALKEVAAGKRATVAMKGYCVVNGEAAAASFNAGPCKLGAWNATTSRREYAAATITALDASTVDGTYGSEEAAVIGNLRTKIEEYQAVIGHNLTQGTSDGDAVKVCLIF